jgi:hypothetical protein
MSFNAGNKIVRTRRATEVDDLFIVDLHVRHKDCINRVTVNVGDIVVHTALTVCHLEQHYEDTLDNTAINTSIPQMRADYPLGAAPALPPLLLSPSPVNKGAHEIRSALDDTKSEVKGRG